MQTVQNILAQRGNSYGNTHKITGEIIHNFDLYNSPLFTSSVYTYNWVQMLGKLIRWTHDTQNRDHLLDLIGYAVLTLELMDGQE